jgi:hypothetical protein
MKTLVNNILITGIFAIVASTSMIAQSNSQFEQWYRAKYGRPSPTEQARLTPQSTHPTIAVSANVGFEQWYRAKYGRPSPAEQARLDDLQVNAALQPTVAVSATREFEPTEQTTPTLGKSELDALIATAKTPAEHARIAQDYRDQAQDFLAQSKEHAAMVAAYKTNPNINAKNQAATIGHCEYFAAKFNDLAVKSQELAKMHEQMATDARKM